MCTQPPSRVVRARVAAALYAAYLCRPALQQVAPLSIDIVATDPSATHVRSLTLTNPTGSAAVARLRTQYGTNASSTRRLDDDDQASVGLPPIGPQPNATKCKDLHRLIIGLAPGSSVQAMRRRLLSDTGIGVGAWQELQNVGVHIAELGCEAAGNAHVVMDTIKKRYGEALDFVELDQRVTKLETAPNDPYWPLQWGMARSKVLSAWSSLAELGNIPRPTVVAVIDTGVTLNHEDLRDVIWRNPKEIPGNGIDDDGNGFIDDIHGYDFVNNDADPSDDDGHGTHCSGVIAATTDNALGVGGIGGRHASVQIMPLKFLGPGGGSMSDAIRALDYAMAMGVPISSNSWGGGDPSQAFNAALSKATAAGHLFVVAAGNDARNVDTAPAYPCSYDNTFCVAATESTDSMASYSNYGVRSVHIGAPGSNVYSTYLSTPYTYLSGTSMATPHVSGAAALLYSGLPQLDTAGVRQLILDSAERVTWMSTRVISGGILDVANAVATAQSSSWLQLQPPGAANVSQVANISVPAGGSVEVPVQVGGRHVPAGVYAGQVNISFLGGVTLVPVTYTLAGLPLINISWSTDGSTVLDVGTVGVGSTATLTVPLQNSGNGTLRLRWDALGAPFTAGTSGAMEVLPGQTSALSLSCSPQGRGKFFANFTLRTNSGLDPLTARQPNAVELGMRYDVELLCSAEDPPYMDVKPFSGALLVPGGNALPVFLEPSVPAQWEGTVNGTSLTAPLAAPVAGNSLGCAPHAAGAFTGKVLLISRGTCTFQAKANLARDAGAVGLLVADNSDPTTLVMMALPTGASNPTIPAFLVTKAVGASLSAQLALDQKVDVFLSWEPVVVWNNVPPGSPLATSGVVTVSNLGSLPMRWQAQPTVLSSGSTQSSFYTAAYANGSLPAPAFDWADLPAYTAIPWFARNRVDDGAMRLQLPTPVMFYGQPYSSAFLSSNGLLVFDPGYSPGADASGSIPSTAPPNGMLAVFWTDLICTSSTVVSAAVLWIGSEQVLVVQWRNIAFFTANTPNNAGTSRASFEARVFADGRIVVNVKDFPAPLNASVRIGTETLDGLYGIDVRGSLPFAAQKPFSVSFEPWLSPKSATTGRADIDQSVDYTFSAGTTARDLQGYIVFNATDDPATSNWKARRSTRVVNRVFSYSWRAGDWGPCYSASCGNTSEGTRSRMVECVGSDGKTYDGSHCPAATACVDRPAGWIDSSGDSCAMYVANQWCTSTGGYGPGWLQAQWGSFSTYANLGATAATACCGCGGGSQPGPPRASEACSGATGPAPECSAPATTSSTATPGSWVSTASSSGGATLTSTAISGTTTTAQTGTTSTWLTSGTTSATVVLSTSTSATGLLSTSSTSSSGVMSTSTSFNGVMSTSTSSSGVMSTSTSSNDVLTTSTSSGGGSATASTSNSPTASTTTSLWAPSATTTSTTMSAAGLTSTVAVVVLPPPPSTTWAYSTTTSSATAASTSTSSSSLSSSSSSSHWSTGSTTTASPAGTTAPSEAATTFPAGAPGNAATTVGESGSTKPALSTTGSTFTATSWGATTSASTRTLSSSVQGTPTTTAGSSGGAAEPRTTTTSTTSTTSPAAAGAADSSAGTTAPESTATQARVPLLSAAPVSTAAPTTTTTAGVTKVTGSMTLAVSNPTSFLADRPAAEAAVRDGIARAAGVPSAYVAVQLSIARRLQGRYLSQSSSGAVKIAFVISIPAPSAAPSPSSAGAAPATGDLSGNTSGNASSLDLSKSLSAAEVYSKLAGTSPSEMTSTISQAVVEQFGAGSIQVTVSQISAPTLEVMQDPSKQNSLVTSATEQHSAAIRGATAVWAVVLFIIMQ